MNDDNIKEKVEENLASDVELGKFPLDVLEDNGVITLAGEVPTQELARSADRIANETEGVVSVISNILINPETEASDEDVVVPRQH
jgi:osmotically-inducible protein OsmY